MKTKEMERNRLQLKTQRNLQKLTEEVEDEEKEDWNETQINRGKEKASGN